MAITLTMDFRWSEPVSGRELHALKSSAFRGALLFQLFREPRCECRLYERQQPIIRARAALLNEHVKANIEGHKQDAQQQAKLRIVCEMSSTGEVNGIQQYPEG
jgi:hypothetical protein